MKTNIIFKTDEHQDIFAIFPDMNIGGISYTQTNHKLTYLGGGIFSKIKYSTIADCKLATPEQSKDLRNELIQLGYNI